ncbi:cell division protein FtsA [Lactobacillus kunkeei]|uniref:Cell division protein FtsA n=1 Tax=Apilactobacillus nanyangensis TaxID=2799579 RepID=A0ABT0HW28_9LACO|nr:cell division protein FtsA [Apilactobacillus nanyangensis]MBC6388971.1 cell division protein FtsA [Apilactobacillus kunkeei]MCK8611133.1 cell division protein FtsA [Apilactobacillus nanyangensis]TMT02476.1 cell division protein FtsA [Apilactobacillus kunkeei]TMT03342.1 cell division protein FtsA [Apilactobacillus kunkeei]
MMNSEMYVGLDIGTTSIKVIVAEKVKGQMNVLGLGNERSEGVSRGIIVDIDKASESIRRAVNQAEEKAGIQIHDVIVGIPANQLKIEPCSGMVAISDQSREISDEDVKNVTVSAMIKNLPPEREIMDTLADEFIVDGFDGIKDPRGMVGVRLEMKGRIITGPKTIIHNIRKAVQRAGLNPSSIINMPLAQGMTILDDGEQDFGTVLIDLGGGQTTASVVHDHQLKFTTVDSEGGEYITKDISVVLNTSLESAEKVKRDYGYADEIEASESNEFPIEVVGQSQPVRISEKYLAEIIQARVDQIFTRMNKSLSSISALNLPGGIVLTGGVAALPGISELAADRFDTNVRVYIPDQMGLRHPSFSLPLSLVTYRANMSEIQVLVRSSLEGKTVVNNAQSNDDFIGNDYGNDVIDNSSEYIQQDNQPQQPSKPKKSGSKLAKSTKGRLKRFYQDFFE